MVVTRIWLDNDQKRVESSKPGNVIVSSIYEKLRKPLLQAIFLNTGTEVVTAKDGMTKILGLPTEAALLELGLQLYKDFHAPRKECKMINIEPFNSVKKKMSVLVALPGGNRRAFVKGASEIVLGICDKVLGKSGESVTISEERRKNITNAINKFAGEAMRTICLAYKDMEKKSEESIPEEGYTLIAVVGNRDPVRPGVKEAVRTCLDAGIIVRMVTGDNINTAKSIARECGILTDDGIAIEGSDFRDKSVQELNEIIPKLQVK